MKLRVSIVCLVVLFFSIFSRHFVVDDGLIYARYMRNALAGQGLVYNAGQPVNALTSPVFAYLLPGLSWIFHGNVLLAEHVLFAVFSIGACALAERSFPWSGVAIASTAYFYIKIGMETTLFLFMILLVAYCYEKGRYDRLPTLLVLATLTRFEGGLLIPIVAYQAWKERRFPRIASYAPGIAIAYLGIYAEEAYQSGDIYLLRRVTGKTPDR